MLATDRALKTAFDDFALAARAADLVADDTLTIRTLDDPTENTLLVTDDAVSALVSVATDR